MNSHNISNDMLIKPFGNGIKLITPGQGGAESKHLFSYEKMLALPFPVYFIAPDHTHINMNAHCAEVAGYDSSNDSIGRSVRVVATKETADLNLRHDQRVMSCRNRIIRDENYVRIKDHVETVAISMKMPWYGNDDKLIGVFGCSVIINATGATTLAQALTLLVPTGIFNMQSTALPNTPTFLPGAVLGEYYLTKREKDVIAKLALGQTAKQIAYGLDISYRTVEEYIANLKRKFAVNSKSALIEKIMYCQKGDS